MLKDRGAKVGVEIGTDHGQYAQQLCEGIPGLKLYCVDPYLAYQEGEEVHTQEDMEQIYKEAKDRLTPYDCKILRTDSVGALWDFQENSIDFVFIDGNHEIDHVYEDIYQWTKVVKLGGIVAGHDYKKDEIRKYGVIEAINNYTKNYNINPWFVLHAGGKLTDCWMFIKGPYD